MILQGRLSLLSNHLVKHGSSTRPDTFTNPIFLPILLDWRPVPGTIGRTSSPHSMNSTPCVKRTVNSSEKARSAKNKSLLLLHPHPPHHQLRSHLLPLYLIHQILKSFHLVLQNVQSLLMRGGVVDAQLLRRVNEKVRGRLSYLKVIGRMRRMEMPS